MKNEFDIFVRDIFEFDDLLSLDLDNNNFFGELKKEEKEENIRRELRYMYDIYKKLPNIREINPKLERERLNDWINNKFIKIIDDIKLYDKYIIQRKIIQGIKVLFKSLNINENNPTYLNIESITGENNKNNSFQKHMNF